jgi:succinate dehydrogenase cytochrome b556 subunit
MFLLMPFIIWLFDTSVSSEVSYERFSAAFTAGIGLRAGLVVKLVVLALIWAYLHHFIAGVRHLWMDATHSVSKEFSHSRRSSRWCEPAADAGAGRQAVRPVLRRRAHEHVNYGSKRIVVGAHYGLRDWLSQRVTAALMALFTLACWCRCCCPARWATTSGPASSRRNG